MGSFIQYRGRSGRRGGVGQVASSGVSFVRVGYVQRLPLGPVLRREVGAPPDLLLGRGSAAPGCCKLVLRFSGRTDPTPAPVADCVRIGAGTYNVVELLLFHHAQGLTAGCLAFAGNCPGDRVRRALAGGDAGPDADPNAPGARGAVLLHSAVPTAEFGGQWPPGVPLQIHTREADFWGDADVARRLAATIEGAELFLYPGEAHLFTDQSLPDYDAGAAALLKERVLGFLERIDASR